MVLVQRVRPGRRSHRDGAPASTVIPGIGRDSTRCRSRRCSHIARSWSDPSRGRRNTNRSSFVRRGRNTRRCAGPASRRWRMATRRRRRRRRR